MIRRATNDQKHAWVERIGDECRANDIPFFLEFVGYEEGADEKGLEYAKKKPAIVSASMAEFSKDRYGVDVLKVEVPINMQYVEGARCFAGQKAYTHDEAKAWFLKAAQSADQALHLSSAGVSNAEFTESLALAAESGVRYAGVLCGRATWKDGVRGLREAGRGRVPPVARDDGVANIKNVNQAISAGQCLVLLLRRRLSRRASAEVMAILKVARLGHPVLRTKAQPVPVAEIWLAAHPAAHRRHVRDMREYQGIGLAAPQVHVGARLFVAGLRARRPSATRRRHERRSRHAARRPDQSGARRWRPAAAEGWEGCLSIPDMRGRVPRAAEVKRARLRPARQAHRIAAKGCRPG